MDSVRIVTVDDHSIFRDGLRRLLEGEPGFQVVGDAGSARDALRLVAELEPDVLLLDLAMPDATGLDVLRALAPLHFTVRTVLLTANADRQQMLEALQLGARGLVLKECTTGILFKCIRAVVAGEYWFGHQNIPHLVDALRQLGTPPTCTPAQTLTRRELHIVAAIAGGATNRDIATQLGLSDQTIKNHLSHIFDKVGVSNRLELALFAIHHNLAERAS